MSKKSTKLILFLLVMIVVIGVISFIFINFKIEEKTRKVEASSLARKDIYLALSRLIEDKDYTVERFSPEDTLWKTESSLMFIDIKMLDGLSAGDFNILTDWVYDKGGKLYISGDLSILSEKKDTNSMSFIIKKCNLNSENPVSEISGQGLGKIYLPSRNTPLEVEWSNECNYTFPKWNSQDEVFHAYTGVEEDICLISTKYGKGSIIISGDSGFFKNQYLLYDSTHHLFLITVSVYHRYY